MEQEEKKEAENKKGKLRAKTDKLIDKAEKYIDESVEKMHQSDAYRDLDQTMEKATKSVFRKAGKLWGKSERYFTQKKQGKKDAGEK